MTSNLSLPQSLMHIRATLSLADILLTAGKTTHAHDIIKSLLQSTRELLDTLKVSNAAPPLHPTFPASCIVHTPSGPTPACERHAKQLEALFECMGAHTNRTPLKEPAPCTNCINEARNKEGPSNEPHSGAPDHDQVAPPKR